MIKSFPISFAHCRSRDFPNSFAFYATSLDFLVVHVLVRGFPNPTNAVFCHFMTRFIVLLSNQFVLFFDEPFKSCRLSLSWRGSYCIFFLLYLTSNVLGSGRYLKR